MKKVSRSTNRKRKENHQLNNNHSPCLSQCLLDLNRRKGKENLAFLVLHFDYAKRKRDREREREADTYTLLNRFLSSSFRDSFLQLVYIDHCFSANSKPMKNTLKLSRYIAPHFPENVYHDDTGRRKTPSMNSDRIDILIRRNEISIDLCRLWLSNLRSISI
jgi:hypothetical protein